MAYRGSNCPNGNHTKHCNQQLKEIHFEYELSRKKMNCLCKIKAELLLQ